MPSSCPETPSGKEALRSFNLFTELESTVTQVRKKTLLNKDEIACSEVTFVFPACFESRIPTTPSNLVSSPGSPKRQAVTWIGSGLLFFYSRIKPDLDIFWEQSFSDSPINGVNPCSRIEDVTNYQNALSKALLVSLYPLFSCPGSSIPTLAD